MNLYEINSEILAILQNPDPETGEIDAEAFDRLNIALDEKIESLAIWCKEMAYEIGKMKTEEKTLSDRRKRLENRFERIKGKITQQLEMNGRTAFETARVEIASRKSTKVSVTDEEALRRYAEDHDLLTYAEPKLRIKEIGDLLKGKVEVPGAELHERRNYTIR